MKLTCYNEIVDYLNSNYNKYNNIKQVLITAFPNTNKQTIGSIYAQECQRRIKRMHARHTKKEKMDEHYFRFCEQSQRQPKKHVLLAMALQIGLQPALLARIILDRHLAYTLNRGESLPKSELSTFMKNICLIEDPILAKEIEICLLTDDVYGPSASIINQSIGHEYEVRLKMELNKAGISFQSEELLRQRGYDKTPDTILDIPIAVDGHIVCWIESKASFGDSTSHANYLKEQYWSYCNRFGSGLVIYWFDFIEELNVQRHNGILLMNCFPKNFERLNVEI